MSFESDRFGRSSSGLFFNFGFSRIPFLTFFKTGYTISLWIKLYQISDFSRILVSQGTTYKVIFSADYTIGTGPYMYFGNSKSLNFNFLSNKMLSKNKWQHLAFTFDGNNLVQIYVDGVKVGESYNKLFPMNFDILSNSNLIGTDNYRYFSFVLDELKIFKKCLNSSQIMKERNQVYQNIKISK